MPHPLRRPAVSRLLAAFAFLLALSAAGCDSPSGPGGVEGSYSVYSVNGHRPPALVRMAPAGEVQLVDADLHLGGDGIVAIELETRSAAGVAHTTYTGVYQASGGVLTFEHLTDGDRDITANGVVVSPREVAVTLHIRGPSAFVVYHVPLILRR